MLKVDQSELEEHLSRTYSDDLCSVPLGERQDIPTVPLLTNSLNLAVPSYEEVKSVVRKARNRSAPGPNGIPYLLYKRCPRVLKILHMLVESAWETGRVDNEWKQAEGVYIPKEKDSRSLTQFRPISLLNVEGKVFFMIMASRLTQYVMSNRYIDTTIQKGGVPGVPGCIEHTTMIWESIQQARRNRLSLYVVWLDLANAYGSVPHQLLWKTLENHHAPIPVIKILQEYFRVFEMRFSTMAYTTKWIPLQVGIAMGCAISPCLFVLAMQVLLNASGSHKDRVHIGRKFNSSSIKAFMDDTILVMNRKQAVQRSLESGENKYKPAETSGWSPGAAQPQKASGDQGWNAWRQGHSSEESLLELRIIGVSHAIICKANMNDCKSEASTSKACSKEFFLFAIHKDNYFKIHLQPQLPHAFYQLNQNAVSPSHLALPGES